MKRKWEWNGYGEIFRDGRQVALVSNRIGGMAFRELAKFIVAACQEKDDKEGFWWEDEERGESGGKS